MDDLMVFNSVEFGQLSIFMINGKEYFPATTCAKALGYDQPHKAIARHCKYGTVQNVPHPQSKTKTIKMTLIPEPDLWRLIIRSQLPAAERYERWVFEEVLPSIRKTGSYSLGQKQEPPYEYFDKEFNGVPVVSTLDIAHFTGLSQANVKYYLNKCDLICGIDYFVAEGRALAKMKKRYPKLSVMISKMLLFTKSGFDKLMKECGANVNSLKCFENIKCSEPVNDMHILIDTVLVELNQLHDTVKKLDRYNTVAEQKLYKDKIKKLERSVSQKLVVISQVDMQNITGNFDVVAIDKKKILESKQYSFLEQPLAAFYSEKGNTTAAILK